MDQCTICYDNMDMKSFKDVNESTTTCTKLECEHSFHTKCIIACLSKTNSTCPLCNKRKITDEDLRKGLRKKLISESKRDPEVKQSISEYKSSMSNYISILNQLRNDTEEFIINRMKEINFKENRDYLIKTMHNVRVNVRRFSRNSKDPRMHGILSYRQDDWQGRREFYTNFFNLKGWRKMNIVNFPSLRIRINRLFKKT